MNTRITFEAARLDRLDHKVWSAINAPLNHLRRVLSSVGGQLLYMLADIVSRLVELLAAGRLSCDLCFAEVFRCVSRRQCLR